MPTNDMTQDIIYTITNPKVTFNQRLKDMAKIAENSIELVNYTELSRKYFENGAMMDMFRFTWVSRKHMAFLAYASSSTKGSSRRSMHPM